MASPSPLDYRRLPDVDDTDSWSDSGYAHRKPLRAAKKRADIQTTIREKNEHVAEPAGNVWCCCLGGAMLMEKIADACKKNRLKDLRMERRFSEAMFVKAFERGKNCFIFRFGTVVCWDFNADERQRLVQLLLPFIVEVLTEKQREEDDMSYVWGDKPQIRKDTMHLVTSDMFEKLAYSYAFAQSVKLTVFEEVIENTIESTRNIPEGLMKTGKIHLKREDISKKIGELFLQRCYVNLHTDILDTPDIFWEFDEFEGTYSSCRGYLEITKRVEILNQRLDIIKDLYDMLHNELTIQHGYKLEWIVIYLICIEVAIEVIWNILIKDVFGWV
ncbi:unnamed protein product [Vitrella brassicaformis CCMP3155]|uniref:DUF155 domain-containing protein n=2 Tax=Vitrella brassicaformis TaxID=1169539 RepID=A0A0G4EBB5_VITBC|nr:unnamed protein product [Vitrella brassicaformis CCMP3155]|mmetsp:Transcript_46128/g.114706  ORF Transcript_46128/g.114706 Transcript_46128/m.114706 type:complete len:330 (+) Transcript_46128:157-1146(+)|eukprot:CEL92988.1 unnamed protein product [Vitrella brassicaformis CCMP3155]